MLALIFAMSAVKYVGKLCEFLFGTAEHVYASHTENAQIFFAEAAEEVHTSDQSRVVDRRLSGNPATGIR
ncbi:MAG TPA: hypothetical protein VGJ20_02585 [Xanthobacteraceae bacterium]|jgi:hypothetical protein